MYLNSNIEIHKSLFLQLKMMKFYHLNSNIEIHK